MEPDYEFDAPQFVDFLQLAEAEESSDVDTWFDQHTEEYGLFPRRTKSSSHKAEASNQKPARTAATHEKPARVLVENGSRPTCPSPKKQSKISSGHPNTPSANTRSKAQRSAENVARQPEGARPKMSKERSQVALPSSKQPPARGKLQQVKPWVSTSDLHKTSEDLELEKIAAMRAQTAKARKLAQESYKKAFSAQGVIPVRSSKPATMPQGFHFSTDSRLKNNLASAPEQKVKDFTATLRDSKATSTATTKTHQPHLTRPQPFKLSHPKHSGPVTKFESDAEKIANFSKKTPQRYKTLPKSAHGRPRSASKRDGSNDSHPDTLRPTQLTVPKSPALNCRGRVRTVHIPTREEEEQMEFEKHQKELFKAHPVNHRVLHQANLGVPKVDPRPLTIPAEFALSRRRSMSTGDLREALNSVEQDHHRFHAKPVNPRIFQGQVGVKAVEPAPPTVPESPAFALKNRLRPHKEPVQQEESHRIPRANRVPHDGVPFRPKVDHRFTKPEPFQVEERSREMLTRRQQKIQQILEEEKKAREFQTKGLPSLNPDQLPLKQPKPVTVPAPFELYVDRRGKEYQEQFRAKLEEERRMQKEAVIFKAGPNTVIQKKAFQPQVSSKPLTEIDEFQLNTDIRAASREHYDMHLKEREAAIEAIKRQRAEQQEREEKAAVARMRKEAVHVATGIKKYKAPVIKPSDMPLTQAQSPNFSQRFRARLGSL